MFVSVGRFLLSYFFRAFTKKRGDSCMKSEVIHQKKFLKDYQKPSHTITHTDLYFHLCGSVATVTSSLEVRKEDESCRFLSLVGSGMELLSVSVDGKKLSSDTYEVSTESLTIPSNSEKMQVEIITKNAN